jgi:hypothetical protein
MKRFEILAGLPGEGPLPEYFGATESGRFREGFVVRFFPVEGEAWVGNFEPGLTGLNEVIETSATGPITVIAGGQGYDLDSDRRACVRKFGGSIEVTLYVPEIEAVVVGEGIELEAIGAAGTIWKSPRLSWDGMRSLSKAGTTLTGEAYDPMTDEWKGFVVDLRTGEAVGGSYDDE